MKPWKPWPGRRALLVALSAASGAVWLAFGAGPAAGSAELRLRFADLRAPGLSASGLSARLYGEGLGRFRLEVARLTLRGVEWRDLRLDCERAQVTPERLACESGRLVAVGETVPMRFAYDRRAATLDLHLDFGGGEHWRLAAARVNGGWRADGSVENGRLARLRPLLPAGGLVPQAGVADATLRLRPAPGGQDVELSLAVRDAAFSDPAGEQAGEKLAGRLELRAELRGAGGNWRSELDWHAGQVYWAPFYLSRGGYRLSAAGDWDAARLRVERATLTNPGLGRARAQVLWSRASGPTPGRLRSLRLSAQSPDLAALYAEILKPYLAARALPELTVTGRGGMDLEVADGALRAAALTLDGAGIQDTKGRFAFRGLSADLPWSRVEPTAGRLCLSEGSVGGLTLGRFCAPFSAQGARVRVPVVDVPVLDGVLRLRELSAAREGADWDVALSGALTPVSMEKLTAAFGWPTFYGTLSGVIPAITYRDQTLQVGGALQFKVFDGTVVVKNMRLRDPLGLTPVFNADLDMRGLDLDLVTRAFSFGSVTGRVDVRVADLELADWQPVRMDARVASSPGRYPRRISQRAVENISALGGAGAVAALQRSFLGFFEDFRYAEIGLGCRLADGVCAMSGIAPEKGGFLIVEGGGVPAINVIGYNRRVDWDELLARLARVTAADLKPVVR